MDPAECIEGWPSADNNLFEELLRDDAVRPFIIHEQGAEA